VTPDEPVNKDPKSYGDRDERTGTDREPTIEDFKRFIRGND